MHYNEALETLMQNSPHGAINLIDKLLRKSHCINKKIYTIKELCARIFANKPRPTDSYGITQASNICAWMLAILGNKKIIMVE
jgi:hypothetical protein